MTKQKGFIGWAGLVLAILILAVGGFLALNKSNGAVDLGGNSAGPTFNAGANFPAGFTLGIGSKYLNRAVIQIPKGRNQIAWKNTYGRTVYVNLGDAEMAGVASTTFKLYVGTSSTATVTDTFNGTAPFSALFINGATIATSSGSGNVVADNVNSHAAGSPAAIAVMANQYLLMVASAPCSVVGVGCETATSSNRGWTTINLPFLFTY